MSKAISDAYWRGRAHARQDDRQWIVDIVHALLFAAVLIVLIRSCAGG